MPAFFHPQQEDRHNNHHRDYDHGPVASSSSSPALPQQVLLEDLTLVIDVALIVAFVTAVHLLRQRLITVATLAHALSVAFLVFTVGHYIERHMIGGVDGVEDLVRRRAPGGGREGRGGGWWVAGWSSAGLLSTAAMIALGTYECTAVSCGMLYSLRVPLTTYPETATAVSGKLDVQDM